MVAPRSQMHFPQHKNTWWPVTSLRISLCSEEGLAFLITQDHGLVYKNDVGIKLKKPSE